MTLIRYQAVWSGFQGAPGYSTFYALETTITPQAFADAVRAFLLGAVSAAAGPDCLPAGAKITCNAFVDLVDEVTGDQLNTTPLSTQPVVITGTGGQGYSSASGSCVNWITNGFRNGRRIRGRTFMVPLGGLAYDTDGTLSANYLTKCRAAATAFVTAGSPAIWSRPQPGTANGGATAVAASSVNDKAAVLTSRRD